MEKRKLTNEEIARIENNRQKAILIKQSKKLKLSTKDLEREEHQKNCLNTIDSGAGFLIEEQEVVKTTRTLNQPTNFIELPKQSKCEICEHDFEESYLKNNFNYEVCDLCRDPKDKHTLITRTDAKSTYLLKDCDLDLREPPLRYISKKNPNSKFSRNDMKLYLQIQVEKRALQVWESEEKLMEEIESRKSKKLFRKEKEFNKKISKLRMEMQSSLYKKELSKHEHNYGDEEYDEEEDEYSKKCLLCGHELKYEKM